MAEDIDLELYETVANACLYNEDITDAIRKYYKSAYGKVLKNNEIEELRKSVLKDNNFKAILKDFTEVEIAGLLEDTRETILLKLNRIIKNANREGKYDTVVKTLDRIAKMLAIEDKQMEFKITFAFKPTEAVNLEMIKAEKEKDEES